MEANVALGRSCSGEESCSGEKLLEIALGLCSGALLWGGFALGRKVALGRNCSKLLWGFALGLCSGEALLWGRFALGRALLWGGLCSGKLIYSGEGMLLWGVDLICSGE
ncbi:MAG: hypothetical protein KBC30_07765 [Planctomycetes bacterium]|nr:hypothetical protein [Planctomycetota bacterium]